VPEVWVKPGRVKKRKIHEAFLIIFKGKLHKFFIAERGPF
jgi:hypothetical protein